MFPNSTLADWEKLVEKQLKSEDIYNALSKPNLEGITVKPIYDTVANTVSILPRVEENMVLVADYNEDLADDVYGILLKENASGFEGKNIYINNKDLAEHISPEESNKYYALVDVFDTETGTLNQQLVQELLAKDFDRNIGVDISVYQNAGASLVQQLAFALLKAKELADNFGGEVLNKITFKVAVGANYFFEVAKIRTLKLLFNQLSREYNLDLIPYIFAESTLRNKTIIDEENNLIRSTLELASAMVAGADAVFSSDFKINEATALSKEIAFKQLIVLAYESIVNVFEDAANGSYYVEDITNQLADKAWTLFVELEEKGGFSEASKNSTISNLIFEHATAEQTWVEEGKIKLVGVNIYPKLEAKKSVSEMYTTSKIKAVRWAEMYE